MKDNVDFAEIGLREEKLDWIYDFSKDFAIVRKGTKYGFINRKGKLICDIKYDWVFSFDDKGYAKVCLNDKWFVINENGEEFQKE